jgi:NAD(P)-dependent dehydrogenase (short-subunit alcohol dehydrogenase family)
MAMSGLRELSVIQTPPVDRLAVRTYVMPWDPVVLREALLREHYRGGQSFFVVPRITDLTEIEEYLRTEIPEVKYVTAHGQMSPTQVEERMSAFYEKRYDVLLSTTIVESGLDIPSANTLIIHRADRFGLAQLYQLRGRVGRSKTRAYAYLTHEPNRVLTETAEKRLKVLGAQTLRLDVANPASNSGLAWQLDGEKIDLAIYVAGAMDRASASTPPTRDSFDAVMHTNVMGAMQVIPQILPMVQETRGVIACISSVMGSLQETTSGNAVLYRVSKAALMVVRCTQAEQPDVTVLAIHPGWVQTDMGGAAAHLTPEQSANSLRETLNRTLEQRDPKLRGAFLNHDGQTLPW